VHGVAEGKKSKHDAVALAMVWAAGRERQRRR
jgi:hypothetical protein